MAGIPTGQVPGVYRRRVGDIVVTAVSDGFLEGSLAVLRNIAEEEAARMLREAFRPVPRQTSVNTYLIHSGGRVALVDTGCGTAMGPGGGALFRSLAAAGVAPEEVDTVLLTHMHPDHSNGLAEDGRALFPNATLALHAMEHGFWHNDAAMAKADPALQERGFQAARTQAAPYRDRTRTFTGGEVFPGVTALPLPGHTPGHTGYMIASGGQSLLIWGDIVHVPEVQVPRPEVTLAFDIDQGEAAASRRRAFDMAATDRLAVAGMHLHFPGFAHLARREGGYVLVPEAWSGAM
ncbi:MAG TPA: MBL fold metallo-hydrolase [Crenalkalicoccus sp.]|nr:MBL fold metallo-hydrolase [Crenalkalicoccus sp.]